MSWFRQSLGALKKFVPLKGREQKSYPTLSRATAPVATVKGSILQSAAEAVYKKYRLEREAWAKRPKVVVQDIVRLSPGGRHAWVMSNVGLIRKPYTA